MWQFGEGRECHLITAKDIQKLAAKYAITRGWDGKRDIIRHIYQKSPKTERKTNLEIFGKYVGFGSGFRARPGRDPGLS